MDKMTIKNPAGEQPSPFWEMFILPLFKFKKITYIVVTASVTVTLLVCLLLSNQYTSTASILPTGDSNISTELKDLAVGSLGELGLGAVNQAPENSSALFPSILTSRLISEKVLDRNYSFYFKSKPMAMTLDEYIDAPNRDIVLKKLQKIVSVDSDRKTGVIRLSVTTKYPELSAAVVSAYLDELDNFNIHHRQTTATENVKFTSQRLTEIKAELEQAEDTLKKFKEANMNYMDSGDPQLQLELTRFQREAELKASIYLSMTQQNEMARLEAAKDIPMVQILDQGAVPLEKSSPRRSVYLISALFGSLFFSLTLSIWVDISIRHGLNRNIKNVVSSSSISMNRLESKIASRISRFADGLEKR